MPLVSVVVPFYNRQVWLEEAVRSVLSQTFKDFELILVDDGSEEDASIPGALEDERVSLVRQENRGRSAARNVALRRARGKYVAFLDSDDLFLPRKLEKQVALMEGNPAVLLSHTSYLQISSSGEILCEVRSGNYSGNVYPCILTKCPIATPTVMVRMEVFKTLSFEENVHVGEDTILWSRISQMSPVLGIAEPLSLVRVHGGNAICDPYSQLAGFKNVMKHVARHDKALPAFFESRETARARIIIAWQLFEQEKRWKSLVCLLRGVMTWPLVIFSFNDNWDMYPDTTAARQSPAGKGWSGFRKRPLAFCRLFALASCFPFLLMFADPFDLKERVRKALAGIR